MIGTTTRESAILSVHNSVEVVDKKHFAGQSDVFVIQRERPSTVARISAAILILTVVSLC
jgi:hypothetical protein